MLKQPVTKLLAVLVIIFVNFFLMINYLNQSTYIQQQQINLEKKITLEQSRQFDQQTNDRASIRDEIQRKLKIGDLEKVPSNEISKLDK